MICATVITIIILFSMIYCFDRLCHQKNKTASNTIYYIISILVSNIYLTNILFKNIGLKDNWYYLSITIVLLIIIEYQLSKKEEIFTFSNKKAFLKIENICKKIAKCTFAILIFMLYIYGLAYFTSEKNEYRIIDDNKAIIYTSTDYYIVLDCEIQSNSITIYKGKEEKINTVNTHTTLQRFDNVKVTSQTRE